jgi:predicted O-methyltransferase YrrM
MAMISDFTRALALARRIRALQPHLDPAAAVAFARSQAAIAPNQKDDEIMWLLRRLEAERPKVVLEIGTDRGGTLFLWTRVAAPDALLVTLDIQKMVGRLGRLSPFALVRRSFARDRQRIELVDQVDSQDEQTVERVQVLLRGRPVDYLFLDGDHRYEAVRRDFELYTPLVRPGGIVAFHDISPKTTPDTEGAAAFWAELKAGNATEELVVTDGVAGYGIGLYCKPR